MEVLENFAANSFIPPSLKFFSHSMRECQRHKLFSVVMENVAVPFMVWDPISQTILNSVFFPALSRDGAQSTDHQFVCQLRTSFNNLDPNRCLSPPKKFDEAIVPRSREHTAILVENEELISVWDEYGLIGDIVVTFCHVNYHH